MKVVAIIQARMGSTRLRGKVLMDIEGRPALWYVVNRLRPCKLLSEVWVATSSQKQDDVIADFCRGHHILCYRGSEHDVLQRYCDTARLANADAVVRITADCPLIDPVVVDRVVETFLDPRFGYDYVSNALTRRTFPRGIDAEVFSRKALELCDQRSHEKPEREHVTIFMYEHPEIFKLGNVQNEADLSGYRWTVDEDSDLEFVRAVYAHFQGRTDFLMPEICAFLKEHPEIAAINSHVHQKLI